MTLLLYALVTPSGAKPRLRGMRGEPLRVVSAAGVGALIGAVSSSPQPQARNLRAYHDVMLAVSRRFTALVPVRFGTAVADEEELSFILRTRAETFRRLLAAVRGRVQMTARFVDVSGGEEDSAGDWGAESFRCSWGSWEVTSPLKYDNEISCPNCDLRCAVAVAKRKNSSEIAS